MKDFGAILFLTWVLGFGAFCAGAFCSNWKLGLAAVGAALMASSIRLLAAMMK